MQFHFQIRLRALVLVCGAPKQHKARRLHNLRPTEEFWKTARTKICWHSKSCSIVSERVTNGVTILGLPPKQNRRKIVTQTIVNCPVQVRIATNDTEHFVFVLRGGIIGPHRHFYPLLSASSDHSCLLCLRLKSQKRREKLLLILWFPLFFGGVII